MSEPCYHLIRVTFQQNRRENLQAVPCAVKWEESDDLNQLWAGPGCSPGWDTGHGAGHGSGPWAEPSVQSVQTAPRSLSQSEKLGTVQ